MLGFSAGRGAVAVGVTTSLVLLVVLFLQFAFSTASTAAGGEGRNPLLASNRKLLEQGGGNHGHGHGHGGVEAVKPERIGTSCSKDDVVVYQGPTSPLPNGIPTYTVQILNVCVSGCAVSRIHLSCGWFSSARLINPRLFRRLSFDDCLVNDGMPLPKGGTVSFQYANSFHYPLSVSSISCLPSST